jgi:hypothetical protein
VIFSFDEMNDPAVINIRPNRVDVVRTTRQMTLAEFNRQNPSVIPLPELAILNQVENENSLLPAGHWKRVVAQ